MASYHRVGSIQASPFDNRIREIPFLARPGGVKRRWSYEKDRRDKRNQWFYVANAFSLLIGRITPSTDLPRKPLVIDAEWNVFRPVNSYTFTDDEETRVDSDFKLR
jgi:hypothetical protein